VIISQTPYRVSFAGGGTDLPAFYTREFGAVLSTTIDHYMYVTIHRRFEPTIRIGYSKTEIVEAIAEIRHDLVREAMRLVEIDEPLEITTIGDVPAGTGLGSSSALTAGLLNALYAYHGHVVSRQRLAEQACRIEIDILKKPIGRQDQYAAAFGGLNFFRFHPDDTVDVEPVPCRAETLQELERRTLLIYTNQTREADTILKRQSDAAQVSRDVLREMRDLADRMRRALTGDGDLDAFASLLHVGWELKRSLGCGISSERVDGLYEAARRAGAAGGKLLGAGGGGFLLLIAPPWRHGAIREALGRPRELPFRIARYGSRNIFIQNSFGGSRFCRRPGESGWISNSSGQVDQHGRSGQSDRNGGGSGHPTAALDGDGSEVPAVDRRPLAPRPLDRPAG
jgi:D-glycero-alpha-D-manno-heptose-7-phosphate kinase